MPSCLKRRRPDEPQLDKEMPIDEFFRLWGSDSANDDYVLFNDKVHTLQLREGTAEEKLWPLFDPLSPFIINDTHPEIDGDELFGKGLIDTSVLAIIYSFISFTRCFGAIACGIWW
jgi:hypothetical protein